MREELFLLLEALVLNESVPKPDSAFNKLLESGFKEKEIMDAALLIKKALHTNDVEVPGSTRETTFDEAYISLYNAMIYKRNPNQKTPSFEPSNAEITRIFQLLIKYIRENNSDFIVFVSKTEDKISKDLYYLLNFGKYFIEFDRTLRGKMFRFKSWDEMIQEIKRVSLKDLELSRFNVIHDKNGIMIIKVDVDKGEMSKVKFGIETTWCTAKPCRKQMPDKYKEGDFYIIIDYRNLSEKPKTIQEIPPQNKYVLWISSSIYKISEAVETIIDEFKNNIVSKLKFNENSKQIYEKIFSYIKEDGDRGDLYKIKSEKAFLSLRLLREVYYVYNKKGIEVFKTFHENANYLYGEMLSFPNKLEQHIFNSFSSFANTVKSRDDIKDFINNFIDTFIKANSNMIMHFNEIDYSTIMLNNTISTLKKRVLKQKENFPNVKEILYDIINAMYQDNSSFISDNIDILMQNSKNILRKLDKIGRSYISVDNLLKQIVNMLIDLDLDLDFNENNNKDLNYILNDLFGVYMFEFRNFDQSIGAWSFNNLVNVLNEFNLKLEEIPVLGEIVNEIKDKILSFNKAYYESFFVNEKKNILNKFLESDEIKDIIKALNYMDLKTIKTASYIRESIKAHFDLNLDKKSIPVRYYKNIVYKGNIYNIYKLFLSIFENIFGKFLSFEDIKNNSRFSHLVLKVFEKPEYIYDCYEIIANMINDHLNRKIPSFGGKTFFSFFLLLFLGTIIESLLAEYDE